MPLEDRIRLVALLVICAPGGRAVADQAVGHHAGTACGELGGLGHDQAGGAVPPEEPEHRRQVRGNIVEEQGPAVAALVFPACSGQPEDSPQDSQVTVGELSQVDVNVALGVHQGLLAC
jgi:hypothetical protein